MCSHKILRTECGGWKSVRCTGLTKGLPTNEQIFIAHFMDRLKLGFGSNLTFLMDFKGTKIMCQLKVYSRSVKSQLVYLHL